MSRLLFAKMIYHVDISRVKCFKQIKSERSSLEFKNWESESQNVRFRISLFAILSGWAHKIMGRKVTTTCTVLGGLRIDKEDGIPLHGCLLTAYQSFWSPIPQYIPHNIRYMTGGVYSPPGRPCRAPTKPLGLQQLRSGHIQHAKWDVGTYKHHFTFFCHVWMASGSLSYRCSLSTTTSCLQYDAEYPIQNSQRRGNMPLYLGAFGWGTLEDSHTTGASTFMMSLINFECPNTHSSDPSGFFCFVFDKYQLWSR